MFSRFRDFVADSRKVFILLGCSLLVVLIGIAVVAPLTFPSVKIERVSFPDRYAPGKENVAGLLVTPSNSSGRLPAVIFSHGATANKEIYISFYLALAKRGIAVLGIDLPGHGGSGGHSDASLSEYKAVWSAGDWLKGRPGIDAGRIAVAGHSLGGITSVRAGLVRGGPSFTATVAIYCWPGFKQAIEMVSGPLKDFAAKIWPLFTWSRDFDIRSEEGIEERDIISKVTDKRPPNFLLIVGERDQMTTVQQEEELVARAAGVKKIEPGRQYGSFEDKTAREIVVTSDDHISEVFSPAVFNAMYAWLCEAFGMKPTGSAPALFFRFSGWGLIISGCFLLGLCVVILLYRLLEDRITAPAPAFPAAEVRPALVRASAGAAALYFLVISAVALPLAIWLGLRTIVPFLVGDMFTSLAAVRGALAALGVAGGLLLLGFGREKLEGVAWKERAIETLWAAVPPAGGFLAFLVLYAVLAWSLFLGPGLPYSWFWYIIYIVAVTIMFWVEGRFFHLLVLPAFGETGKGRRRYLYLLSETVTRALGQALVFVAFLPQPFHVAGLEGSTHMPLTVVVFLVGLPIFFAVAWIDLRMREKHVSLVAPSLFIALFQGWFITAVICLR